MRRTLWTIGHSTHPLESFVALLKASGVETVADIRAFPGSRRHPHFSRESLAAELPELGMRYLWLGRELGGRRRARPGPGSNDAILSPSFRAYADHMASPLFAEGVARLLAEAERAPTAYFCAEVLWWRCHRSFLSDYLTLARGWTVLHIIDEKPPKPHKPKAEARLEDGNVIYPAAELGLPGISEYAASIPIRPGTD